MDIVLVGNGGKVPVNPLSMGCRVPKAKETNIPGIYYLVQTVQSTDGPDDGALRMGILEGVSRRLRISTSG